MDEINKTVLDYSKKKDKESPLKYDLKETFQDLNAICITCMENE